MTGKEKVNADLGKKKVKIINEIALLKNVLNDESFRIEGGLFAL